jgi:uncharacterized protein YqkB
LGNYLLYKVPGLTDAGNLTTTGTGTAASSTMNNTFLVGTDGKLNPNAQLLYYDNWRDYFLQNKFRQEYNISVSGATDKTDYYIICLYAQRIIFQTDTISRRCLSSNGNITVINFQR